MKFAAHIPSAIPLNFGAKRDFPAINIYVDGQFIGRTTWAMNTQTARTVYAEKYRLDLYRVKAYKAENSK